MMKKLLAITSLLVFVISACANFTGNRPSKGELMIKYENLLEKNKVKEAVNRLFISTDNRDWDTVSQLFAPEVLFDMTSMVGGKPIMLTPQEIVSSWEKGLKPLNAIHHQAGNYIVSVNEKEEKL